MDSNSYVAITRQMGLLREMQVVANNIANAATTGFRQEGVVFSEYVQSIRGGPSISMGQGNVGKTLLEQGTLTKTGGTFDFAIEGDGYFLVNAPGGQRMTRAGSFSPNAAGELVTMDGYPVLDAGGAPVFVPPGAESIAVASDGTISADGQPVGQIGVVEPLDPTKMVREDGVMFRADEGFEPSENSSVLQGFKENSNVQPILQVARMVEVQRAYEMGQSFLDSEDERIRRAMDAMVRQQR